LAFSNNNKQTIGLPWVPTASDWYEVDNFIAFRRLLQEAPQRMALDGSMVFDTNWLWPDLPDGTWVPLETLGQQYFPKQEPLGTGKRAHGTVTN
jgi:hypothetical protein